MSNARDVMNVQVNKHDLCNETMNDYTTSSNSAAMQQV